MVRAGQDRFLVGPACLSPAEADAARRGPPFAAGCTGLAAPPRVSLVALISAAASPPWARIQLGERCSELGGDRDVLASSASSARQSLVALASPDSA